MDITRIIAIRHGETSWNVEGREMGQQDSPLTPRGIAQAKALAVRLAEMDFQALYSSDTGRAYETARFIAEQCDMDIVTDVRLRERNMGIFEGLTIPEMRKRYPEIRRQFQESGGDFVVPEGESSDQRQKRAMECFEELAGRHPGGTVVAVTHGGVLAGVFQYIFNLQFRSGRFRKDNAGLNVFQYTNSKWILETWNDICHLKGLVALDDGLH